eukprot:307695-Amphidinium_carterae.1
MSIAASLAGALVMKCGGGRAFMYLTSLLKLSNTPFTSYEPPQKRPKQCFSFVCHPFGCCVHVLMFLLVVGDSVLQCEARCIVACSVAPGFAAFFHSWKCLWGQELASEEEGHLKSELPGNGI